jgi:hypothetical protein
MAVCIGLYGKIQQRGFLRKKLAKFKKNSAYSEIHRKAYSGLSFVALFLRQLSTHGFDIKGLYHKTYNIGCAEIHNE